MTSNKQHTVYAPRIFRFVEPNINTCVSFINSLINGKQSDIYIDFAQVIEMEHSDYMVLTAQIEKAVLLHGTKFYRVGKKPKTKKVNDILIGSKKVKHFAIDVNSIDIAKTAQELNPFVIKEVVMGLSRIGIKESFDMFEVMLSEIVGNATEHGIKESKINWWLIDDVINSNQTVNFTFLDMGRGIIGSHKKAGLPWRYKLIPDTKIPLHSLYGKLRSSTKDENRGLGLQQVRKYIEEGVVENFLLITNCVSLRYSENKFRISRIKNFEGTYFSWSISKESYNKWKNTK